MPWCRGASSGNMCVLQQGEKAVELVTGALLREAEQGRLRVQQRPNTPSAAFPTQTADLTSTTR